MSVLVCLLVALAVCSQVVARGVVFPATWEEFEKSYGNSLESLFRDYREEFSKKYIDHNHEKRNFGVFSARVKDIFNFNAEKHTWTKGINHFTDLSDEERRNYVMPETKVTSRKELIMGESKKLSSSRGTVPKTKPLQGAGDASSCDLRPFMTSVKNQASCGSCWAFGTIAAAEASHQLWSMTDATGQAVSSSLNNAWQLSEQTLLNCCGNEYEANGCGGGGVSGPMQCAVDMGTLPSAVSQPYLAAVSPNATQSPTCTVDGAGASAAAYVQTWYEPCGNADETCLKSFIGGDDCSLFATTAMKTSIEVISSFYDYAGGVYSVPNCPDDIHNHAVAIVGWGTDASSGMDYWIVRNSWGASWGQNGYIYMQRGNNMCCIACENLFFQ